MNNMLRDFNYLQRLGPTTHGQLTKTVQGLKVIIAMEDVCLQFLIIIAHFQ